MEIYNVPKLGGSRCLVLSMLQPCMGPAVMEEAVADPEILERG